MKNFFLYVSISTLGILALSHSMTIGLNKSTLNQCTNNNDNSACNYLIKNGSNYEKNLALITLENRGF